MTSQELRVLISPFFYCPHFFVAESVAQDLVKNALKSFSDHKITELYDVASERMISLSEEYHSTEKIHELVSRLDAYKSH